MPSRQDLRAALARTGLKTDQLAELEDHVACAIDAYSDSGLDGQEALRKALLALGTPAQLTAEYEKVHPSMKPISKLLGITLSLAFVSLALRVGTNVGTILNLPSLLMVGGFTAGALVASFGPHRVARTLAVGLGYGGAVEPGESEGLIAVARRGYQLSWAAGALGMIAGVLQMLIALADPALLGRGIAMSLLSVIYGALLAELLFGNLHAWVADRRAPAA